jgi:hypothetical protein
MAFQFRPRILNLRGKGQFLVSSGLLVFMCMDMQVNTHFIVDDSILIGFSAQKGYVQKNNIYRQTKLCAQLQV